MRSCRSKQHSVFVLVMSLHLVSACAEKGVHVESCFSEEVTSGRAGWGTCDFEGYLVTAGLGLSLVQTYQPETVRECVLNECPIVGY